MYALNSLNKFRFPQLIDFIQWQISIKRSLLITCCGQNASMKFAFITFGQITSQMSASKRSITTIGEQLRTLRENANLSLREVAGNINIDTSLLGKIERNERQPTKEQIKQIAKFFKVNEKQLIKEMLSDQFAYKIIEEGADLDTLRVAEEKVEYLKKKI